jgi:hypothetical protein
MKKLLTLLLVYFLSSSVAHAITRTTVTKNSAGTMSHVTAYVTDGGLVAGQTVWIIDSTTGVSFFANVINTPDFMSNSGVTFLSSVTMASGTTIDADVISASRVYTNDIYPQTSGVTFLSSVTLNSGTTLNTDAVSVSEIHARTSSGISIFEDSGTTGLSISDDGAVRIMAENAGYGTFAVTVGGMMRSFPRTTGGPVGLRIDNIVDWNSHGLRMANSGDIWNTSMGHGATTPYYITHYSAATGYVAIVKFLDSSTSDFARINAGNHKSGATLFWGTGSAGIWKGSDGELYAGDDAGGAAKISPHDPETGHWQAHVYNEHTGESITVDMYELVKIVSTLSGRDDFYVETAAYDKQKIKQNVDREEAEQKNRWVDAYMTIHNCSREDAEKEADKEFKVKWPKYIEDKIK